jgi:hypothetical protein
MLRFMLSLQLKESQCKVIVGGGERREMLTKLLNVSA